MQELSRLVPSSYDETSYPLIFDEALQKANGSTIRTNSEYKAEKNEGCGVKSKTDWAILNPSEF